jgi:DNA-binding CsgD family transcriptional regulator
VVSRCKADAEASKVAALGNFTNNVPVVVDWHQVAADSGIPLLAVDADGRVLFANNVAARIYAKRPAKELLSLRLTDFLPGPAAAERLDVSRQVSHTGESVVFRELWAGFAMRATVRPVELAGGGRGAMWVFATESALLEETEKSALRAIEAKHTDLGPLAGLTNSELKVLALIGEGLSNADIAARLHRAVKTIESHRASLTEKTGSASRVQLGIMAQRAGLARRVSLIDTRQTSVSV